MTGSRWKRVLKPRHWWVEKPVWTALQMRTTTPAITQHVTYVKAPKAGTFLQ
jgi:hypothetical protein